MLIFRLIQWRIMFCIFCVIHFRDIAFRRCSKCIILGKWIDSETQSSVGIKNGKFQKVKIVKYGWNMNHLTKYFSIFNIFSTNENAFSSCHSWAKEVELFWPRWWKQKMKLYPKLLNVSMQFNNLYSFYITIQLNCYLLIDNLQQ